MRNTSLALRLSYATFVIATILALVAAPFIIIAGIGLLIALPFGWYAYKESAFINLIKKNSAVSDALRLKRKVRILSCFFGGLTVLGLIWYSNSVSHTDGSFDPSLYSQATLSFFISVALLLGLAILMVLPQLIYRKR